MHAFKLSRALFWLAVLFLAVVGARPWIRDLLIGLQAEPRAIEARGDLAGEEKTNIAIFQRVSPSVVYITTSSQVVDLMTRSVTEVPQGTGTGFVWDRRGHVVTNYHVIEDARSAYVRLADRRTYEAALVGVSRDHDIAVLRISERDAATPVPIGTSSDLRVGQKVLAIGNPFGLDYTLTTGVISALNRTIPPDRGRSIQGLIQTDAAINPGNSGGPLLDSAGRMIGMNTAILSDTGQFAGIGFAVPVDIINRVVPKIIAYGHYIRPTLGVLGDDAIGGQLLLGSGVKGVPVLKVEAGSPAERAGLRAARETAGGELVVGDTILAVDATPVDSMRALIQALEDRSVGDAVILSVRRSGQRIELRAVLGSGTSGG